MPTTFFTKSDTSILKRPIAATAITPEKIVNVTPPLRERNQFVTTPGLSQKGVRDIGNGVRSKVLVVDDEPEAVELVEFNLKQAGYTVVTAADGSEAITKARAALPSVIVL